MSKNVKLWVMHGNMGEQWSFDDLELANGQRNDEPWTRHAKRYPWISCAKIPEKDNLKDNDQSGNTISFLNTVTKELRYQENDTINTVNVYEHCDYTIQAMYVSDRNYMNYNEFNYFSSLVNTESAQIYGPAIFFKTQNNCTVDLSIEELLVLLVNFYYVKSCKLNGDKFENIAVPNYEPHIDSVFKGYYKKKFDDWIILSESKTEIDTFQQSNNDLNNFKKLIFFKLKRYAGEIHDSMMTTDHDKDSDYRGLYMDIDERIVRNEFFV